MRGRNATSCLAQGVWLVSFVVFLKYLLIGIIQGVAEVLPISSSGHVELFKVLLGVDIDHNLLFLIFVNTGSLVAFLCIFAKDIARLVRSFFLFIFAPTRREENREEFLFVLKLGIASIPAMLVGLLLSHAIDAAIETYGTLLSGMGLFLTGTILLLTSRHHARRSPTAIGFIDATLIGVAQATALLPGLSRSGVTVSTGINRGLGLGSVVRFSFMMYLVVSFGSLLLEIDEFVGDPVATTAPEAAGYAVSFIAATIATFAAYKLVMNAFRSEKLRYFAAYCFAIGLLSVVLYVVR